VSALPIPRWAVSFADLTMLLLAYFVLLHIGDERTVMAGARAAFAGKAAAGPLFEAPAAAMFEPGEARLKPEARLRLAGAARKAAAGRARLVVASAGRAPAASRFDGWELGAARAAAVARALADADAGIRESDIEIVMPPSRAAAGPQRLTVETAG
jgi:flagellar motor protein MotB